jgi:hypothetical protein
MEFSRPIGDALEKPDLLELFAQLVREEFGLELPPEATKDPFAEMNIFGGTLAPDERPKDLTPKR